MVHAGWLQKTSDSRPRQWFELREDHCMHYFDRQGDDEEQKIGVVELSRATRVSSFDNLVLLRKLCGFKLVTPGLLSMSLKFFCANVAERDEWVDKLTHAMKWQTTIAEEKSANFFWGDLRSDVEVDLAWTGDSSDVRRSVRAAKRQAKKERDLNQDIVLFHRVVNKSYGPKDFVMVPDDLVERYLPLFLQMPQLIDVLYQKLSKSPLLHVYAYLLHVAKVKVAPKYLSNASFLAATDAETRTHAFFAARAAEFPLKVGDAWDGLDILDPVWGLGRVQKVSVTKVFASGHAPCLLSLEYHANGKGALPPSRIMLKDDDVRSDTMVLVMFEVFNALWLSSGLLVKPELITFRCIPGGPNFGFMEFVENSGPIRDYDFANIASLTDDEMDIFLSTAAGGYIGGFLLGIRDRHEDNLMVKDQHKFFQLDFKHAFNNKTFGIDGCRFAISNRFKSALEQRGQWRNFKGTPLPRAAPHRTMAAYMVLRRNSQIIIQLSRALFKDLFPNAQVEEEMLHAFYLDRTEDAALHRIDQLIESGVGSWKRILKKMTHELSGNTKPKSAVL